MSYTTLDLVDAISDGNTRACEEIFNELTQNRIDAAIERKRAEIGASMFATEETEE